MTNVILISLKPKNTCMRPNRIKMVAKAAF
jgi:hypothetical protein